MANSIDFLKQTKSLNPDTSLLSTDNQTVKDKPSLFDSLLSGNKTDSTQNLNAAQELNTNTKIQVTNSDLKEEIGKTKESLSSQENKEETEIDLKKEVNSKETTVVKEKTVSSTSSLLDRLVLEAKKDVKAVSQEQLKNLDSKIALTQDLNNTEEVSTDSKVKLTNSDLKEEIGKIKESLISVENKEVLKEEPEIDLKKDTKVSQEQLKNLDSKIALTQDLNNTEEVSTDSKEEIGKIKESLISVENKEVQEEPEIDLKKDVKAVSQEQSQVSKKIDIRSKDNINLDVTTKVSINNEETEVIKKTETKVEDKIVSFDNKQNLETELDIEKIIIEVDKNITVNSDENLENEMSNNSKISISNNISVPLSDTLNSQDSVVSSKNTQVKSLMDQLIQKNSESIESIAPDKVDMMQRESASKDFISNIYLSTQKNSINTQNLFNKNEAVNLLKDATNIKDVKTSAQMLDLGLEDISIDENLETQKVADTPKKLEMDLVAKRNILDNLMSSKNIVDIDVKNLITKSVEASSALLDDTLKLSDDAIVTVNSPLSYNIQSKIIGARQQMSTMMSDIARQMYENYKPPVTVFKINLNPLELGSIAILMKNDKNNSLSISMNVSNNSTLDALIDNQNVLKTSLNKSFDENTKFNLNFSSSSENNSQSNNQSNQNNQGNQSRFEQQIDTQSILELKEENKDREEKSIDYM